MGAALPGDAARFEGQSLGVLMVDAGAGMASWKGRPVELSRRQVELLSLLVANQNRVLSRLELSNALGLQRGRSIDVLLSGIRHQLGFEFVRNVPKRGWIIIPEALHGPGSPGPAA
jgi:two-component system, OmpR family, response regulator QseB